MDKLISLLNSFFSLPKIAAVTVPGIIAAAAVAILMYPPAPEDMVPFVEATPAGKASPTSTAACEPTYDTLAEVSKRVLPNSNLGAQTARLTLERLQSALANCVESENSKKGGEATKNSQLNADIEVLEKDLTDIQVAYQGYEKSNNPIRFEYRKKYDAAKTKIDDVRQKILSNEQTMRERDRRLAELARAANVVADRLKDPERLRPSRTFDEAITVVANHAVALALLAIAIGVLFNPINRAFLGVFYDLLFEPRTKDEDADSIETPVEEQVAGD